MSDIKTRVLTGTVGVTFLWAGLESYKLGVSILIFALILAFREYCVIFNRITSSQTGKEEEGYINELGSSWVCYMAIFSFVLSATKSNKDDAEKYLCWNFLLFVVLVNFNRIFKYSRFCAKISVQKKKQRKAEKNDDKTDDDAIFMDIYKFVRISTLCFNFILGDLFFILCIVFPMTYAVLLLNLPQGNGYVFVWLFSTFQTDNGALFFGKMFGKNHIFPSISPKKTREGAFGAYILNFVSMIILMLFGGSWIIPELSFTDICLITLMSSTQGILGDAAESFVKRVAMVKDSGSSVPGHGGILDRIDSLILGAPIIYYYTLYNLDKPI